LNAGAISKEEVLAKPDAVLSCLETQSKFMKQEAEAAEPPGEMPEEKSVSLSMLTNTADHWYLCL